MVPRMVPLLVFRLTSPRWQSEGSLFVSTLEGLPMLLMQTDPVFLSFPVT